MESSHYNTMLVIVTLISCSANAVNMCEKKHNKTKITNKIYNFNDYSTASDLILLWENVIIHYLTLFF